MSFLAFNQTEFVTHPQQCIVECPNYLAIDGYTCMSQCFDLVYEQNSVFIPIC